MDRATKHHLNRRRWPLAGLALVVVTLSLAATGCSTLLRASGVVYEPVDAPAGAAGEVDVDMPAPLPGGRYL
jgi:hypothetical protein